MNYKIKTRTIYLLALVSMLIGFSASQAKAYDPEAVKAYNQAIDYSQKSDYTDAITYFKKATLLDPDFTDAYFNLGAIYEYQNNPDLALEYFTKVFRSNSKDYESIYKIASIYEKKGDYRKALDYASLIPSNSNRYLASIEIQKQAKLKISQQQARYTAAHSAAPATTNKVILRNFYGPTGIAKDKEGNLYVANYTNNSIVKIYPNGQRKTLSQGGLISGPVGLAVDRSNNIYVANYKSNQILKITPQGTVGVILKWVKKPYYLFVDGDILYISEQGNNSVIKLKI